MQKRKRVRTSGFLFRARRHVSTTPEKFKNGNFTVKTHQMFFVHTTPETFDNATVAVHGIQVLERSGTGLLIALIDVRRPTRSLRSSDKLLLNVPKINTVTYGQRAFSYVAVTLWNSIPDNIRNSVTVEIFKTRLKTFLFKEAYNSSN